MGTINEIGTDVELRLGESHDCCTVRATVDSFKVEPFLAASSVAAT